MALVDLHTALVDTHHLLYSQGPHHQDQTLHPPHPPLTDHLPHPLLQAQDPQALRHHLTRWLHQTSHPQPHLHNQDPQEHLLHIPDHPTLHLHTILHLTHPTLDLPLDTQAILQHLSQIILVTHHIQQLLVVLLEDILHLVVTLHPHNKEDTKDTDTLDLQDTMATHQDLDHLMVHQEAHHKAREVHPMATAMLDKDPQDIHLVIQDIHHKPQVAPMEVLQHLDLAHLPTLHTKVVLLQQMMDLVDLVLPMDLPLHKINMPDHQLPFSY